jgi:hypothetical protein
MECRRKAAYTPATSIESHAMTYLIENHPAKTMIVSIICAASMLFFLF